MPSKTYAEAAGQARKTLASARLNASDEHFPYKHDTVVQLLADDTAMGPGVPDGDDGATDTSRTVADYTTRQIADASRDYVDAQAAFLDDNTPEARSAYEAARDQLIAARLDHRQNRGVGFTVGAAARRAG